MKVKTKAEKIVATMLEKDAFSRWLGVEVLEVRAGFACLQMQVRPEMLNGFDILHGGVSFAFADSAFAFACNSRGRHAFSIDTSVAHLRKVKTGELLTATASEEHLSHRTGLYRVEVRNADGELVALFKGSNYRSSTEW